MGHLEEIKIAVEASMNISKLYLSLIVKDKNNFTYTYISTGKYKW